MKEKSKKTSKVNETDKTNWRKWVQTLPDDHEFRMSEVEAISGKEQESCGCIMVQHGRYMGFNDFTCGFASLHPETEESQSKMGGSCYSYGLDSPYEFVKEYVSEEGVVVTAGEIKEALEKGYSYK